MFTDDDEPTPATPVDRLKDVLSRLMEAAMKGGMSSASAERIYDDVSGRLAELSENRGRGVLKEIRAACG